MNLPAYYRFIITVLYEIIIKNPNLNEGITCLPSQTTTKILLISKF